MSKILVFGHQNPDMDTVGSAISLTYLMRELSVNAEAVVLGKSNAETKFALDYFRIDQPRMIETASNEVDQVVLVDHNEAQQSVSDIDQVTILGVVDHHRIANFETNDPLYYRAEPVGCTATIISKLYKEYEVEIPANVAGLMLSAIISDTLLLKSPTTTDEDVHVADELSKLAGVSLDDYGLKMLKAGTDISSKTAADILNDDAKSFDMGNQKVRIGQVNVVDINDLLINKKQELLQVMKEEIREKNYDLYVLMITDIIENNSVVLVEGSYYRKFEMAFNKPIQLNTMELDDVVSRKKQVIPPLTEVFDRN